MIKFFFQPKFNNVEVFTIALLVHVSIRDDNLWILWWILPVTVLSVIMEHFYKGK